MEQLPDLSKLSTSQKDDLIHVLWEQNQLLKRQNEQLSERIVALELQVKKLEDKLNKNSSNSSKPPSSDGFNKPAPKSLRGKSKRQRGGQPGHKGSTLKRSKTPDKVVVIAVEQCEHCGSKDLSEGKIRGSRQIYDIPPLKMEITEFQIEERACRSCAKKSLSKFPKFASRAVQYGPEIKSFMVYLHQYQLIPYERLKESFKDLFNQTLSMGSLYNTSQAAYTGLEETEHFIKEQLISSEQLNADESQIRYTEQSMWLHVASNEHYTHYGAHEKRGREGIDKINILPKFKGTLIHDHFKTYFHYGKAHALCNAHILRELVFLEEQHKCCWAKAMRRLLINIKKRVEASYLENCRALSSKIQKRYRKRFMNIIVKGRKECPMRHPPEGSKRKVEQSKGWCLLERLRRHNEDVLRFMSDPSIAFDNNLAERDIRMIKVKQKISGCYRSKLGAHIFCRIRSYISTLKKNNLSIMDGIKDIFYARDLLVDLARG